MVRFYCMYVTRQEALNLISSLFESDHKIHSKYYKEQNEQKRKKIKLAYTEMNRKENE